MPRSRQDDRLTLAREGQVELDADVRGCVGGIGTVRKYQHEPAAPYRWRDPVRRPLWRRLPEDLKEQMRAEIAEDYAHSKRLTAEANQWLASIAE